HKKIKDWESNFRLPSDIQSKESTLQVVYDVLRRCPFFQAFLVTADVPEIYMEEFWAIAIVHHHSIRFKMNNKKHIINLETFRDMLHVCPRVPGQSFDELPFEAEILEFLRFLGHSDEIRHLTDVNVNKLFQPWRSFGAVINKCLTRKSSGFDSFRLYQAQILWGLYHSRNIDYAFLIWEDFVYQIEHKKQKKGVEMYYPRFTKVVIHHFMSKDLSIPRRNKINWHYARDDNIFSTIKVVSRHQDTQQYEAILPIELTNENIRNTTAFKEYYACATGVAAPKPKASAREKRGDSDTSLTPPIATPTPIRTAAPVLRLSAAAKGKQPGRATTHIEPTDVERIEAEQLKIVLRRSRQETHISQQRDSGTDEGTGSRPGVPDVPSDDSEEELSWNSFDDEDVDAQDEGDKNDETRIQEEEEADELYRDVNINQGRGLQLSQNIEDSHVTLTLVHPDGLQESSSVSSFVTSMLNPISDAGVESIFTTASSPIISLQTLTPIMTPSTIATITTSSDAPIPPSTIPSIILENLPTFNSVFRFDERLRSLETTFSEYRQTNPFVDAVSAIPGIVHQYMTQQMTEAVREAVQIQTDQLQDSL
nr:hypothetical protein [Tanacetum cinerariifolium]